MIVGLMIILIVTVLVGVLVWIAYNFQKYKGKLYAKILLYSGNTERVEITEKDGSFDVDKLDKSFSIEKGMAFLDHWLYPRKTIYYLQDRCKPIGYRENDDGDPVGKLGSNISPAELNDLFKVKFAELFANQSQSFLDSINISKKWLFVGGIVLIILVLLFGYGDRILELVGSGGGEVVVESAKANVLGLLL